MASIDLQSVLQRGYAGVITENGIIPHSVSELTIGENLVIQLAQGKVTVKVIEVTESWVLENIFSEFRLYAQDALLHDVSYVL